LITLCLLAVTSHWMTAQAPGGVNAGLTHWFKADAGTSSLVDGATLTSWNDQGPNGSHATQATSSARPQFYNNVINGYPAILTSSTRFFNVDFSAINNTDNTIFTVTKRTSSGTFFLGVGNTAGGLHFGYGNSGLVQYSQYSSVLKQACDNYVAGEQPTIICSRFDQTVGKKLWFMRDGVLSSRQNTDKSKYSVTGTGRIGRGNNNWGFNGYIAEVIIYNRALTDAEKRAVQTYLNVKYGASVPVSEHLYFEDTNYQNDVFGIGQNTAAEGLTQLTGQSLASDDIIRVSNASAMDNGDYLFCGNNNGTITMDANPTSNCAVKSLLNRKWKFEKVNTPGLVTLRFDVSALSGVVPQKLYLFIDQDLDGFQDETPTVGSYSAPYLTFNGANIPDGAIVTVGEYTGTWYAVASGNASGVIWSDEEGGTAQALPMFCEDADLVVPAGFNVTNDWLELTCKNFTIKSGGVWNAGSGTLSVKGDVNVSGLLNAQSSNLLFKGAGVQNITGTAICNVYTMQVQNPLGVVISAASGGVRARNVISVFSGSLTTNNKLTLTSDLASTGMIGDLTNGSIIGNVTVNRYHIAVQQGWVNLSCPVANKTLADWNDDMVTSGFPGSDYPSYPFINIQHYDETVPGGQNTGFVPVNHISNPLVKGRGYFVFMNPNVLNLDVDGQIHSGDVDFSLTYTNTGNASVDGWNLVGNPYPSTIDWNSPNWVKTNMSNAVYVWNASLGQYAAYVNGVGSNGGSRYIAPSQSFFVVANAAAPQLRLKENCKSTSQATFKTTDVTERVMSLTLSSDVSSDEVMLMNDAHGTLGFDEGMDAFKIASPIETAVGFGFMTAEGNPLSINAVHMNEVTELGLHIHAPAQGDYTITANGLQEFAPGICVSLVDYQTGETYDLNAGRVTLRMAAGDWNGRFALRFTGVTADYAVQASSGAASTFDFDAQVQKGSTCEWSFGDGYTATGAHVNHEYMSAGEYEVSLIVRQGECYSSVSKRVMVSAAENGLGLADHVAGKLIDGGLRLFLTFAGERHLSITVYNMVGQQITETYTSTFSGPNVDINDSRIQIGSLIDVRDTETGERVMIRVGN
ncbi:MAG: PKD domain-containing protein, partial [Flavobacteriales bacterium]